MVVLKVAWVGLEYAQWRKCSLDEGNGRNSGIEIKSILLLPKKGEITLFDCSLEYVKEIVTDKVKKD